MSVARKGPDTQTINQPTIRTKQSTHVHDATIPWHRIVVGKLSETYRSYFMEALRVDELVTWHFSYQTHCDYYYPKQLLFILKHHDTDSVHADHANSSRHSCPRGSFSALRPISEMINCNIHQLLKITNELRKNGVQLYSSKQPRQNNTGHGCGSISTSSPNIATLICDDTARYITLYRSTGDSAMDFCEVQVFVCDAGTFGYDCSKFCHCRDAPCNYVTGECTGGCKPDWTGRTCSVCDSDHYGTLCEKSCSSRHCDESRNNSSCNKMTGRCDDECIPGWMDQDCTKKCSESKYGQGCANFCSQRKCLGNSSCHHVDGKCDHGCDRGYQSEDCTKVCPSDKYGFNCIMFCEKRNCYGNSVCDSLNGACVNGCLKGWDLPDCVTECHNNTFGPSCMFKCSERLCKGDNSTCDIQDGVCQYGCQTGWKNANCTEKCDSGSYGPDCAFDCNKRHCQTKSANCNHVNGSCGGECENNYKGIDCAGCDGKYGPECSLSCSDRHCKNDNAPCDHVTGSCDGPCDAGYQGDACAGKCAIAYIRLITGPCHVLL
ncbi:multiple epidermal growth factor-like domains protein 10 [Gigantopelta aegis]|uniref:multiple epidermal growth factor-like domains protein 10 n=1 Tax=Gigantopelta aegis TaxID=1735272 RepID=UPI001B88857D|nr:multiple epidermal growth factor-like domains protein 10 [Gigantopelta aegis]